MLVRLMYASRAVPTVDQEELLAIVRKSKANNPAAGITGVLCFSEGIFLQALEGGRSAVNQLYARIVALFGSLPRLDRPRALALAETATQRGAGAEGRLDLLLTLFDLFLSRLARAGILGQTGPEAAPDEAALLARLSPHDRAARDWASLHQTLGARARHGRAVNLDPGALVLDMILRIDQAAGQLAR